jgi:hypothetical protein
MAIEVRPATVFDNVTSMRPSEEKIIGLSQQLS